MSNNVFKTLREKVHSFFDVISSKTVEFEEKSFLIALFYSIPVAICIFLIYFCYGTDKATLEFTAAVIILISLIAFLGIHFRMYAFFSYVFVIVINFLVLPIMYIITGDISAGIPMYFLVGIIATFFLIRSRICYLFLALELIIYSGVLMHTTRYWQYYSIYRRADGNPEGMAVSFIISISIPMFVILYQTRIYEKIHKNVQKSNKMIEESRSNKSRFLSNMTHEIRTPMNAIVGMNEIMLREDLNPVAKELAEQIKESSAELLKIINNVLEFSKLDSDKLELYPQKYSFKNLISGVLESVANAYTEEEARIYTNIDPSIPASLFGDDIRIRQVFMYLLFSGVHKLFDSRVTLEIGVEKRPETNTVLFKCRVSESGLGLSEIEIDAMLSAYTRYDSRQRSDYKGMGLELSICKEILEKMGGTLTVESVEGVGTAINFTFENYILDEHNMVYLDPSKDIKVLIYADNKMEQKIWQETLEGFQLTPKYVYGPNAFKKVIEDVKYSHIFLSESNYDLLKDIVSAAECQEDTYVVSSRTRIYSDFDKCKMIYYPLSCLNVSDVLNGIWNEENYKFAAKSESVIYPKAKVLIVDDSMVNLRVLKGILKVFQIIPDMATNAEEAMEHINRTSYNLLIIDQFMPDVDGVELLQRIKSTPNSNSKAPVICATADFGPEVERRLKAEGFQDYLAKPIRQHYLERTLRRFIPQELAENISSDEVSEEVAAVDIRPDPETIDFNKGVENVGGSIEAYAAVLNAYYREGCDKMKIVPAELEDTDLNLYVVDVHALKSSSASIGAEGLSLMFKDLEFAGRENRRDFLNTQTQPTLLHFESVLEKVKIYLTDNDMYEADSVSPIEKEGEISQISMDTVLEMQNAINTINLRRCEEIINELYEQNFGSDINRIVVDIKNSYDMFDYHKVKMFITDLIDFIS